MDRFIEPEEQVMVHLRKGRVLAVIPNRERRQHFHNRLVVTIQQIGTHFKVIQDFSFLVV